MIMSVRVMLRADPVLGYSMDDNETIRVYYITSPMCESVAILNSKSPVKRLGQPLDLYCPAIQQVHARAGDEYPFFMVFLMI